MLRLVYSPNQVGKFVVGILTKIVGKFIVYKPTKMVRKSLLHRGGWLLALGVSKTFVQPHQLKKNTAHPLHVTSIEANKGNWLSKRSSYKLSVVVAQ
jgi:hypothetical protein